MQFSGVVTLLTWECMQNNALPGSVATQLATKVLSHTEIKQYLVIVGQFAVGSVSPDVFSYIE